jgi:hypothetical protein
MKDMWPEYDFSKYVFSGNYGESVVICKVHGEQIRTFKNVVRSGGIACGRCASSAKKNTEIFLSQLKEKFPETWNKCDFSKTSYTTALKKVVITCKEHEDFRVQPAGLLINSSRFICQKCNIANRSKEATYTKDQFLESIKDIKSELDDFSNTVYVHNKEKIEIICLNHGPYYITPGDYRSGKRCRYCTLSLKSLEELKVLRFIENLGICCETRARPLKGVNREVDIYIPNVKIGVEYNGLFFHRDLEDLDKLSGKFGSKLSILEKLDLFSNMGIQIVHIFEDEWLFRQDVVKYRLRTLFNKDEKILAENCNIREISSVELNSFENTYSLRGSSRSTTYRYGVFLKEELVSSISFSMIKYEDKTGKNFEIASYNSKITVVGGFQKLLQHFISKVKPKKIIHYVDRRWESLKTYLTYGFKFLTNTKPTYFWYKGQKRYDRSLFPRNKLNEIFRKTFDSKLSTAEIMYSQGYSKISDCGQNVLELELN